MTSPFQAGLFGDKLPSAAEMAEFDRKTIEAGTPSLELMESAASAVHQVVNSRLRIEPGVEERVVVLCGPGNNGGDGLALARNLYHEGTPVEVLIAGAKKFSADFHIQARKLAWAGMKPKLIGADSADASDWDFEAVSSDQAADLIRNATVIVDAVLGSGQNAAPRDALATLLKLAVENMQSALVIAVDTPSGVNVDSGELYEPHLKANFTVCIELIKRGLLQYPARDICGDLLVASIGIDCEGDAEFSLSRPENLYVPARRGADFHKSRAGHVLVLGGCAAMPGAPLLAAEAALRSGAGLISMGFLPQMRGLMRLPPELMLAHVSGHEGACFAPTDIAQLAEILDSVTALVLGPGIGRDPATAEFVFALLEETSRRSLPVVIDADATNLLAQASELPQLSLAVLTPHPGEMARLLKTTTAEVQRDRYAAARELAVRSGAVVVLKGAHSIVYDGVRGWVNTSGNPSLATAGSGDVLTGVIAALIAQTGTNRGCLLESARAGVYLHGLAGDMAANWGKRPIIASDIIRRLPHALGRLQA